MVKADYLCSMAADALGLPGPLRSTSAYPLAGRLGRSDAHCDTTDAWVELVG